MRLDAKVVNEQVSLKLFRGTEVIGLANMPRTTYREILRALLTYVMSISREELSPKLGELLWAEAVSQTGDTEIAKKLLADIGLTQEKIDKIADILAVQIATKLAESTP